MLEVHLSLACSRDAQLHKVLLPLPSLRSARLAK